jgi:hypothetical protein
VHSGLQYDTLGKKLDGIGMCFNPEESTLQQLVISSMDAIHTGNHKFQFLKCYSKRVGRARIGQEDR